jgi:predicted TIM-barrel fold metal-dependent hydrolase
MLKHTSLGDFEIFDAHTHFFSHRFFSLLATQSPSLANSDDPVAEIGKITGLQMPAKDPKEFAAEWVRELDRHSVSRAMMMASLPGDEESIAAAVAAFPDRFTGGFFFNPTIPDAIEQARRAFDELNLKVICLFPAMHCYSVGDSENVRSIARLVAERPGTAIFVHCGALSVGIRSKLGIPSRFDLRKSSPLEVHKLAVEFPEVNFIIPHFGAGMFVEAMMAAELCPNIYIDTSSSNRWIGYFPQAVTLEDVFGRAIGLLGPKRLLFGTDSSYFPRGWNASILDIQLQAMAAAGLSKEEIGDVLGGNLRRLLGETSNLV